MSNKRFFLNQHIPFSPAKSPIPYSWVILIAAIIGVIMSIPGQTMGVSVFTDYLIEALKIERFQLSNAYLIGTLASATLLTRVGQLYDRFGGRIIAMFAATVLGGTLILVSFSDDIARSVATFFNSDSAVIPFVTITICFFLLRFSGQGVLTMISRTMLMKWWIENRGFANGLSGIAVSFGFSVAPGIYNGMIEKSGWENTLWQLALVALCFVVFAFIFFRDDPKTSGSQADGGRPLFQTKNKRTSLPDQDATLKVARGTYVFWIFALAFALFGLYITAVTFHIADIFEQAGKTRTEAFSIFVPTAFVALFFHFFGSWISDYIPLKYLLWLQLTGIMISSLALINLSEIPASYYFLIFGNGMVGGLSGVLTNVSWPRFFGLTHLGAISGLAMSLNVAGSAIGPALFSLIEQQFGAYTGACYIMVGIAAVLLVLALRIRE